MKNNDFHDTWNAMQSPLAKGAYPQRELEKQYIDSEHGRICVAHELQCLRCSHTENVSLPEKLLTYTDEPHLSGDFWMREYVRKLGWIVTIAYSGNETLGLHMLCPACVREDFERDQKRA